MRSRTLDHLPHRTRTVLSPRRIGLALAALLASLQGGLADQIRTFAPICAAREIEAITIIEDHGEAGHIPSQILGEAGLKLLVARSECYAGRVAEAVALYDRIIALGPVVPKRNTAGRMGLQ